MLLLVSVEEGGIGEWLIEEEVKGVSEILTRFIGSYPLFEMNEHGVEDIVIPETEVKGDVADDMDAGKEESLLRKTVKKRGIVS